MERTHNTYNSVIANLFLVASSDCFFFVCRCCFQIRCTRSRVCRLFWSSFMYFTRVLKGLSQSAYSINIVALLQFLFALLVQARMDEVAPILTCAAPIHIDQVCPPGIAGSRHVQLGKDTT